MRFVLAILIAIWFSLLKPRDAIHRAWGLLLMFRALIFGRHVPRHIYHRRLAHCADCPIYFSPLRTCGSPFMRGAPGCWCFMPHKARLPRATCWLNENPHPHASGFGWAPNLESLT